MGRGTIRSFSEGWWRGYTATAPRLGSVSVSNAALRDHSGSSKPKAEPRNVRKVCHSPSACSRHLAFAALLAISRRRSGVIFAALALPP